MLAGLQRRAIKGACLNWDPTIEGVGTNRYAYSANDPVNKSDPNGHAFWDKWFGGGSHNPLNKELNSFRDATEDMADDAADAADLTKATADFIVLDDIENITEGTKKRNWRQVAMGAIGIGSNFIGGPAAKGGVKGGAAASKKLATLLDSKASKHILQGDGPNLGGGHKFGVGKSGKTEFPAGWSDAEIEHVISDIATDPNLKMSTPDARGYVRIDGSRDGIDVSVIYDTRNDRIVTGYPINVPRNP